MSIQFIHTADIHLGMSFSNASFGYQLGKTRREELKETFFSILDQAVQEGIDFILIAGDLFEENFISVSDLKDIQKKFSSMESISILICAGNHDPILNQQSYFSKTKWSDNVHIFSEQIEKICLEKINVDVYSFSWNAKQIKAMDLDTLVIDDPTKTNILMLHGDSYTQSAYLPLNMRDLKKKGFDYIALGHIHKADLSSEGWAYPGSPEPLDFKEPGPHGIIHGTITDGKISTQFQPIAKRSFIIKEVAVNGDMSFEEIKNESLKVIQEDFSESSLYRLILNGRIDPDVHIQEEYLKEWLESTTYYCEIINNTQLDYDLERIKMNNKGNLIGEFIQYMESMDTEDPLIKDALYEGLGILLSEKED